MRKLLLCLAVAIFLSALSMVAAYDDAEDHNKDLSRVLFGTEIFVSTADGEAKDALRMLELAAALAIDQFGGTGGDKLDQLTKYGAAKLPKSLDVFDLTGVSFAHHRNYTHQGWDFQYPLDKANWPVRKHVITATVEKVFAFQSLPAKLLGISWGSDRRTANFGALVYYVHILGDHVDANMKMTDNPDFTQRSLIAPLVRAHADSANNPDIIGDLVVHLEGLFARSQSKSRSYRNLMNALSQLRMVAGEDAAKTAGLSTNAYAGELLDTLQEYLPILLRNEPFFQEVFYPERM